jgi:hypothetical protein
MLSVALYMQSEGKEDSWRYIARKMNKIDIFLLQEEKFLFTHGKEVKDIFRTYIDCEK